MFYGDVSHVNKYVNLENLDAWFYNRYYAENGTFGLGVMSTCDTSGYGSDYGDIIKVAEGLYPPNVLNIWSGVVTLKEGYSMNSDTFPEVSSHTYGVIPIITVNISN